jgi:hypothetical protein
MKEERKQDMALRVWFEFTISNYGKWDYRLFANLKFQKTDSDSIRPLTNKPALIQTATYLKSVSDRAKKQIMVYTMFDTDTRDGKLDSSDIKCYT